MRHGSDLAWPWLRRTSTVRPLSTLDGGVVGRMRRLVGTFVLAAVVLSSSPAGATSRARAHLRCHGHEVRVLVGYTVPLGDHAQVVTITVSHDGTSTVLDDHVRVNHGTLFDRLDIGRAPHDVSVSFVARHEAEAIGLPSIDC